MPPASGTGSSARPAWVCAAHQAGLVHGHLHAGRILLTGEGVLKLCGFGEPLWLLDMRAAAPGDLDASADLAALAPIAVTWAAVAKGKTAKPWPESLQTVLQRLSSRKPESQYAAVDELLRDLKHAKPDVPANPAAWERFLQHVREQVPGAAERLSA